MGNSRSANNSVHEPDESTARLSPKIKNNRSIGLKIVKGTNKKMGDPSSPM
jgi:hypothetical protein